MKFILAAVLFLSSTASFAAKNVWADCGIGALIFEKTAWAAATSNIIWDLGTTATSTKVSSEDQCNGKSASAAKYIHQNYAQIQEDTVMGGGEYTTAMLDILNCDASVRESILENSKEDISKSKKQNSESFFNSLMKNIESNHSDKCQTV